MLWVSLLGVLAAAGLVWFTVSAWHDVQLRSLLVAEKSFDQDVGLRDAIDRVGREGMACIDPTKAPQFVERLGYVVLPRDKYIELLAVVRDTPADVFDVDEFLAEIYSWRQDRDGMRQQPYRDGEE